jgi:hypothetical protein
MAVVWRAYDLVLGRPVAVKLLTPSLSDPESRERIRAEAKMAARLGHPNIASVYDFGESWRGPRTRVPYLVMELVDGQTLATRLHGEVPHWRTAVRIAAEVAAALATAHASGIVHRDVKPANIMLARTGVKVVDFGIAAATGALEDSQGLLLGTPAYVAPERIAGEPAVPATDVYALGVVLYQSLTGDLPWPVNSASEVIAAHRQLPPTPLPPIEGLPTDVAELCLQCLGKRPEDRPTSLYAALVLAESAGIAVALPPVDELRAALPPTSAPDAPTAAAGADAGSLVTVPARLAGKAALALGAVSGSVRGAVVRADRRRALAVVGTLGLIAIGAAVTAAQFDGAGQEAVRPGAAASPRPAHCSATYVADHSVGGAFTAQLIVTNTGDASVPRWQVAFAMPAGQRITGAPGVQFQQVGDAVTVSGDGPLAAGRDVKLTLRGTYADRPAPPTSFMLGGVPCEHTSADVRGADGTGTGLVGVSETGGTAPTTPARGGPGAGGPAGGGPGGGPGPGDGKEKPPKPGKDKGPGKDSAPRL